MIKAKQLIAIFGVLFFSISCSDFDEQSFTVLLPDAGNDFIFFTEESGTMIELNGSSSSDVNGLGFEYQWSVTVFPEGFEPVLSEANTPTPSLNIDEATSGRITLSLIISRGDQQARDFVNIDVNPRVATVLLVNAIEGQEAARIQIPSANIEGDEVAPLSADNTYHRIVLDETADAQGNVTLNVLYNDSTLTVSNPLEALSSYTLYLVGSESNPELIFDQKRYNENTTLPGQAGLGATNLSSTVDDMVLFIDASSFALGIRPVDAIFSGQGVPEQIGPLNFGQSADILVPLALIFPLPIWATVNGERVSNDSGIALNRDDANQFGTFVLFEDSSSAFGNTLVFINNSALLPE